MSIKFYRVRGEKYGGFSNFSPHGFWYDGRYWKTSEHYFQAQKFDDVGYQEKIRNAVSPAIAARLGRSRAVPIRPTWEQERDEVMLNALRAKFNTYPELKELLLSTGDKELIEDSPIDYYWGIGKYGTGKNMLGVLLMKLREEYRNV